MSSGAVGTTVRIGAHVSVAGSLAKGAEHAHLIGGNTLQIFSASPRMWKASLPRVDEVRALHGARERLDLRPLVIHDNYLINLASADGEIRAKSIEAFRGELARAVLLEADYLVAHPGSYKGQSIEEAMTRIADGLVEASRGLPPNRVTVLLENTAGQGAAVGSRLEELAEVRRQAAPRVAFEIGYCLDTAHSFAAGYAIHEAKGLEDFVRLAGSELALDRVRVIHANDSKGAFGSRLDRHEHIGRGYIGEEAFRRILQHSHLRDKAFILETPVVEDGDDARNIETLKRLCRRSRTTPVKSK